MTCDNAPNPDQPPRLRDLIATPEIDLPVVECVVGETLRRVRVWSEECWDATPPERRPSPAEHCPGLGWVVAGSARDPR